MKRKVMLATLAIILITLSVTGATFAYFTTQALVTNTLTTGKINIAIVENFNPEDAINLTPTNPENPKKIKKEVRIQNQGGESFVRVKFIKNWGSYDKNNMYVVNPELATDNIKLFVNEQSKWQKIDEYYYTKIDIAEQNRPSQSDVLLESFSFLSGENDNLYKGKIAHIDVVADAIQIGNQAMDTEWGITYNAATGVFSKGIQQVKP